jgi:hypothetical protein
MLLVVAVGDAQVVAQAIDEADVVDGAPLS